MPQSARLFPLILALTACAGPAAFAPDQPAQDILPQDASKPLAVDDWSAKDKWIAKVTVSCHLDANGEPSNCAVRKIDGNPAFGPAALEYANSLVFLPGFTTGKGDVEPDHILKIGFHRPNEFWPRDTTAGASVLPPIEYPSEVKDGTAGRVKLSCTVQATGTLTDCSVLAVQGNPAFAAAALRMTQKVHYSPAWHRGHAVPEPEHVVMIDFPAPFPPFANLPKPTPGIVYTKVISTRRLSYPDAAADRDLAGDVLVICDLGADGINRNCAVAGIHGDPLFGPPALDYVSGQIIHATSNGVPVAVPHRGDVVTFRPDKTTW